MKGLFNVILAGVFVVTASTSLAATTKMQSSWVCTTNASSSSVDSEKKADDKMAKAKKSVSSAFAYAKAHCRDCTKITCEAESK